jgi:hypothetical protein
MQSVRHGRAVSREVVAGIGIREGGERGVTVTKSVAQDIDAADHDRSGKGRE